MKRSAFLPLVLLLGLAFTDLDLPVSPFGPKPEHKPTLPPIPTTEPDDPHDEPPPVFFGEEIDSSNNTLVYVIDTSGSMSRGKPRTRLERAKEETCKSIAALSPAIRFNVVSYDCSIKALWPAMRPANDPAKQAACAWVQQLVDLGGTGTGPAVALALSDREVMAVALLTDGAPTCGAPDAERHRQMIHNANVQRASIDVFGIDATGGYRTFCQNVASDSGGSYFDVP